MIYNTGGNSDASVVYFDKILVTHTGTSGRRQYHCSAPANPSLRGGRYVSSALLVHLQAENFLQTFLRWRVAIGAYIALFHFFHNHIEGFFTVLVGPCPTTHTGFYQFAHDFRILVIELCYVQPIFRCLLSTPFCEFTFQCQ